MYTIHIGKIEATRDVDFAAFTDAVKDYVITYGLTQILNDAHSQLTVKIKDESGNRIDNPEYTPDNVAALVDKKLAALIEGKLRGERMPKESADPVKALMAKIARTRVEARAMKNRVKLDKDALRLGIEAELIRDPDGLRARAQAMMDDVDF